MKARRQIGVPSCLFLFLVILCPKLYGKGILDITQSDTCWHLQLNVPVLDLFNLDTIPRSQKLKAHIKSNLLLLNNPSSILSIPQQCKITKYDLLVPEEYRFISGYGVNEQSEHNYELDEALIRYGRSDIEVILMFNCIEGITQLNFDLFETFPGFYSVDVDWRVNFGSGKTELTMSSSTVYFSNQVTLKS